MAVLNIRTALGPQATKDRREYKLKQKELTNELKLAKETTKQVESGNLFGPPPVQANNSFLGLDFSDPNVQIGTAAFVVLGVVVAKKRGII